VVTPGEGMWLLLKSSYSFANPLQPKARTLLSPAHRAAA